MFAVAASILVAELAVVAVRGRQISRERRSREVPSTALTHLKLPGSEEELTAALCGFPAVNGLSRQVYRVSAKDLAVIYGQKARTDIVKEWLRLKRVAGVEGYWIPLTTSAQDAQELFIPCCSTERFVRVPGSGPPVAVLPLHPKFRQDLAWRTALVEDCGQRRMREVPDKEGGGGTFSVDHNPLAWEPGHVRTLRRMSTLPTNAEDDASLLKWSLCAATPRRLSPWPVAVESAALEYYGTPLHKLPVEDRREWMRAVRCWVRDDKTWISVLQCFVSRFEFEVPASLARDWPELKGHKNVRIVPDASHNII